MLFNDLRNFEIGRLFRERNVAPLAVAVGSWWIGWLFWRACGFPPLSLERASLGWMLLATGLAGVVLAWYLWRLLARLGRAENRAYSNQIKAHRLLEELPNLAVHGYNQNREIIFWNEGSERLYGYRREEVIGRSLEDLLFPPSMRAGVIRTANRWFKERQPIPSSELDLVHKDGSWFRSPPAGWCCPADRMTWNCTAWMSIYRIGSRLKWRWRNMKRCWRSPRWSRRACLRPPIP